MGLVVCVAMLLGLIQLELNKRTTSAGFAKIVFWLLMALGVWNAGWYGLRHLGQFWGYAALASGISMIFSAVIIASESTLRLHWPMAYKMSAPIRTMVVIALAGSFLLYAITLIKLNLGLPIIR